MFQFRRRDRGGRGDRDRDDRRGGRRGDRRGGRRGGRGGNDIEGQLDNYYKRNNRTASTI